MSKPYKTLLAIDFETRWDKADYTLSKMTTEEYIRDPRFKAFGVCIHEYGTDKPIQWYGHNELNHIFSMYDWTTTAVLAHNAMFDVAILSMVYGVKPCFIFDSLSMGRALRGVEVGNSLMKLAEEFGLPPKGRAVHSTDGLEELTPAIEKELADYCKHDVFLCEAIFTRLVEGYPSKELRLIDMTMRMFTDPVLELDVDMLEKARDEEGIKLTDALAKCAVKEEALASNEQFAALLVRYGITPPKKISKVTGKEAYALAKNDAHFQALLNGDNEEVALLCEARLRVKSTLERTRAQRFIDIASRGTMPVPLAYYGAETGRWQAAKGGSINFQNMKRGSFLRKAIMAPDGQVLIVGDLSQIEPRVLAWVAGYDAMLDIFRAGGDPYSTFGSQMFSLPGLNKEEHPVLRQSAKSALLGCGYQLGWASFAAQLLVGFLGAPPKLYVATEAKQLGVDKAYIERFLNTPFHVEKMLEIPRICTDEELVIHCVAAKKIVEKYRAAAEPVVDFWNMLQVRIVRSLMEGEEYSHKGVFTMKKEEIVLVNGMSLKYPNIEIRKDERGRAEYIFGNEGKKVQKLYAGRICNNIVQGLARIVMSDGMLRVGKKFNVLFTVHDEFGILAPEAEAENVKQWVHAQMTLAPKWMPEIPLNSDVGYHRRYGLAK
jgi:DNA polymerase